MATLRDIKRRITGVTTTMHVTNAMKMVSTAKLNSAQRMVRQAQPYGEEIRRMVQLVAAAPRAQGHPLLQAREHGRSRVLLFTSDRGMCGTFNARINNRLLGRLSEEESLPDPELVVFGRVGKDFFEKRGFRIASAVTFVRSRALAALVREAMREAIEAFLHADVAQVFLAYNEYFNPLRQEPRIVRLLPVVAPEPETPARDERELLIEPAGPAVLDSLLQRYVHFSSYLAHLNNEAGENAARMVAMDSATRNAHELIRNLTLQYNRARQAAITKELIEIVNGAQAL